MKFKYVLLIGLLSALMVVAGCNMKPGEGIDKSNFAGQATYNYGDNTQCLKGSWFYKDASGKENGPFEGCTEFASPGQPWCPLKFTGEKFYLSGGKYNIDWKYCQPSPKSVCKTVGHLYTEGDESGLGPSNFCEGLDSSYLPIAGTLLYDFAYFQTKDCTGPAQLRSEMGSLDISSGGYSEGDNYVFTAYPKWNKIGTCLVSPLPYASYILVQKKYSITCCKIVTYN